MSSKDIARFWLKQSREDWKTAESLQKSKRYVACLFFLHLTIEKRLKAIVVVATNASAPYMHDLVTLARVANLPLTKEQEDHLREVNTFNIRARYDDYKYNFYKKATAAFTRSHLRRAEQFLLWLQNHS